MTSGIYCIYFNNTDRVYIGKSLNIEDRWNRHINELKNNKHHSYKLQQYYNLGNLPKLMILEETLEELETKEVFYIKEFNAYYDGFNCTTGIGVTGSGHEHSCAKYSKEKYVEIIKLLAYTNKDIKTIASELHVSEYIIQNISCLRRHTWISKEYPIEYELISIKNNLGKVRGIDYTKIELAFQELINTNKNLRQIGEELNLTQTTINHIFYGEGYLWLKIKYPKEYLILENKRKSKVTRDPHISKQYKLQDPLGKVYVVLNQKLFAEQHKLCYSRLNRLIKGHVSEYRGWKLIK